MSEFSDLLFSSLNTDTFYANMLEQATDGVMIIDDQNRIVFFNGAAENLWGCAASSVLGHPVDCLLPLQKYLNHQYDTNQHLSDQVDHLPRTGHEITFTRSNGDDVIAEISLSSALIGINHKRYYMIFIKDVTEAFYCRKIVTIQNDVFKALADHTDIQNIANMLCHKVEQLVPGTLAILLQISISGSISILSAPHVPDDELLGLNHATLSPSDIQSLGVNPLFARQLIWDKHNTSTGSTKFQNCQAIGLYDNHKNVIGIFSIFSYKNEQITDWSQKILLGCSPSCVAIIENEKNIQKRNQFNALDSLTGLLNRTALTTHLRQMLAQATQTPFAILILDIDLLQDVNNVMGYHNGDILLQTIARRIAAFCHNHHLVARLGGDDFVVILPDADRKKASALAHNLNRITHEPIKIQGRDFITSLSIGISFYPNDGNTVEDILAASEIAMRQAKKQARGSFRFFGKGANSSVRERLVIGSALREALQKKQLYLAYQPQICALSGALCGVEALSRWHHPTLGVIPPSTFIPIAEETGQIEAIGLWSLEKSCEQITIWEQNAIYVPIVSVNMSAVHFGSLDLPEQIVCILKKYNLAPHRLTIEITESVMMRQDPETTANLTAIRNIGVGLSMDDFGTGFSSLSRLAQIPLTEIKIDRSFIEDFENNISSLVVAEAAINIGKRLGIKVVTEGVEHKEQEIKLQELGCDILQGYLYSKPLTAQDFPRWLAAFPSRWQHSRAHTPPTNALKHREQ